MDEAGKALGSRALLIQTPGSLEAGEGTFRDAEGLFSKADVGMKLAWETRGESWEEEGARVKLARLLERHGMVHVTDPFKSSPVHLTETAYFRLHGLPGYDLKYTYRNRELLRLYGLLKECEERVDTVYAFFNNYAMYRDAERLLALHEDGELPPSPFGPRAVGYALRAFEGWPATKKSLLDDCGGWYCWVAPDESVKLRGVLGEIAEGEYGGPEELEEEVERIWGRTGYPTSDEIEEGP